MTADPIRDIYNALLPKLIDEDMASYQLQSSKFLSSHKLATFRDDSPELYKMEIDGKTEPFDTVAYAQGRGAHTLILEGREVYDDTYTIGGLINPKTGKPYGRSTVKFLEWCEEENLDPEFVLTPSDHELNLNLWAGCMKNPEVVKILSEGVAEKVLRAEFHGVECQIRPDWTGPTHGFTNLKTTADLRWFEYDAKRKFNYIAGESFYRSVAHAATPELLHIPCTYIAVEKKPPYRAAVFEIDPEYLDAKEEINCEAIDRLIQCRETNFWPTGFEGMNVIKETS